MIQTLRTDPFSLHLPKNRVVKRQPKHRAAGNRNTESHMLFNSWEFLILLLVTVPLYYLPMGGSRRRLWQVTLLLAASAVFYAWEEPRLLVLLAFSCVANAVAVERILFWKTVGRTQPDPPTSPSSAA